MKLYNELYCQKYVDTPVFTFMFCINQRNIQML